MKKTLKIVGGFAIAVFVVLVIALLVLPMLVDAQDVKDRLSAEVKAGTGRELSIPGDVELSVFPWLGARLGKVSLGNPDGFSSPVFASTEKVDVRVKLVPLLSRRVEMDTVTLHGLTLNLERNKAGKSNWEDLGGAGDRDVKEGGPGAGAGGDGGKALAGIAIGGIDIQDGTVTFTDAKAGQSVSLHDVSLVTGPLAAGEPVDLELGFDVESASSPIKGRMTGSARVEADQASRSARIGGLKLAADLSGDGLPGGGLSATLGAEVSVDGAKGTAAVRDLVIQILDLSASGQLDVTRLDSAPVFSGELELASFSPRKLMKGLGVPAPETADPAALSKASLSSKLSGGVDALSLDPLMITLDDSRLSGTAGVRNFSAPAVRFALELDGIDLDRYLPPGVDAPPATPGAAAGAAGELPVETLRGLDVSGTVKAGKLKVAKLNLKDGLIRLSPLSARLYEGSYAGNIGLDARKKVPVLSLDEKLAGVQAAPLLRDLQGEAPLGGTANVSARLTARGTAPAAVKSTLNGDLAFQFLDGALNGVNIGRLIREARALIKGERPPASTEPERTDFAEMKGTASVNNGVVTNRDLSVKSPLLRLTGEGTASLPAETLDYRTTVTLVETSKGQGGKELEDLEGIPIPLRISGTFTSPQYGLDTEGLVKAIAESEAKDLVKEQKGKVQKKAGEKLGDSVNKLLGGDKEGGGVLNKLLGK